MQRQQLELLINSFIIVALNMAPCSAATFGSSKVFYCMEGETTEVRYIACMHTFVDCTKGMSTVRYDRNMT